MPKGKPLANLMDNEVVEVMYTCIKHAQNNIEFSEVAKELGLKDANAARTRLARVMKAQQKGGGGAPASSLPTTPPKTPKAAGGKRGRKAKNANDDTQVDADWDDKPATKKPKLENGAEKDGDAEVMDEAEPEADGEDVKVEQDQMEGDEVNGEIDQL